MLSQISSSKSAGRVAFYGAVLSTTFGLLAACSGPQYPACETDDQCKADKDGKAIVEYCVNKQCQECRDDSHCDEGDRCNGGRCEKKPECAKDADCPTGKACQLGSCKAVECSTDEDCADGKKCSANICIAGGCSSDQECGAGMVCDAGECIDASKRISAACRPTSGAAGEIVTMQTINFDFNKFDIRVDAREALDQAAACLKEQKSVKILIEGHCDERGTQEYNLALGERRANAVRSYLKNLGIDGGRMRIVSKGKNELVCEEESDTCHDRNRRTEFIQSISN